MRKIVYLSLIVFFLLSSISTALVNEKISTNPDFTLIRDDWGIAHIIADSDEAAFFGAGYATAQDRMFQMHRNRRAVQGRLAEITDASTNSILQSIIDQDTYMRHVGLYRYAVQMVENLDEKYLNLLDAYCQGINFYIAEHPEDLHPLFNGEIPEDWTVADCIASWDRLGDFFSGFPSGEVNSLHEFESLVEAIGYDNAIDEMTVDRIIDDSAAVTKYEDYDPDTLKAIFDYLQNYTTQNIHSIPNFEYQFSPKMSHAWVVGGERSTTNSAVLSSDPQTKVSSPSIWYEIHMKGASFDVRGIGVAGCPGFIIGWNQHVAWGATALGADQADLFRLKMVDEETYEFDGIQYQISITDERIKIKNGRDVSITIKETMLGPVVTDLLSSVYADEEFVLCAMPQWDKNTHSIEALIDMMEARDVFSFYDAIETYRSPGIHCIFGDDKGNIGYSVMAGIPLRSFQSPLAGAVAQDGSSSDYAWVEMIPYEVLPHVFNPDDGVLFTANHLPVGSWYPIPLHLGQGGSGDGARSWRLRELLNEDTTVIFSPEDVYDVHYDDVDPTRREVIHIGLFLRDEQGHSFSSSAGEVLNILQSWFDDGAHCVTSERYYAAAHHMDLYFRESRWPELTKIYGGGESGLCNMLKTIKHQIKTNNSYIIGSSEIEFFEYALSSGYDRAVSYYGENPEDWMDKFSSNGPGKYSIPYFDTLENFGSLDRSLDKTYYISNVNGATIGGQMGQSYSQWVNLADVDSSRAILPLGISEHPESPYFNDEEYIWLNLMMRSSPINNNIKEFNPVENSLGLTFLQKILSNIQDNRICNPLIDLLQFIIDNNKMNF